MRAEVCPGIEPFPRRSKEPSSRGDDPFESPTGARRERVSLISRHWTGTWANRQFEPREWIFGHFLCAEDRVPRSGRAHHAPVRERSGCAGDEPTHDSDEAFGLGGGRREFVCVVVTRTRQPGPRILGSLDQARLVCGGDL